VSPRGLAPAGEPRAEASRWRAVEARPRASMVIRPAPPSTPNGADRARKFGGAAPGRDRGRGKRLTGVPPRLKRGGPPPKALSILFQEFRFAVAGVFVLEYACPQVPGTLPLFAC